MSESMPADLPGKETTINGSKTRRWTLEGKDCPALAGNQIARLGIDMAQAPYQRVRLRPAGSFFLACLEGEGRMVLEGRWQRVTAGELCMAPPRILNALRAVPGKRWVFAWVRYEEPHYVKPLVGADSPLRLRTGGEELGRALCGLRAEWEAERDPNVVHHWVCLIQALARRAAQPWRSGSRVKELWETVGREIATDWKLVNLAERCHMSAEHLRRICLRELGRSPMEHVTYMRMQRAQELLATTDQKLESIAPQVGYRSATVFSRAFFRCVGMTPSAFRSGR
jgi:AraC-like DNA-binding protein